MTAVAKALAANLSMYRQCRVTRLQLTSGIWHLQWQDGLGKTQTTTARSIIAAIPAPQIMPLLSQAGQQSKMDPLLCQLARVQFDAVITVMAGYDLQQAPVPPNLPSIDRSPGWMIFGDQHDTLRWAGLDSSKRLQPSQTIIVLHSSARFAAHYLDHPSVPDIGREFLAAVRTQLGSWLTFPNWHQTHRWRYGFVTRAFDQSWVSHDSIPGFIACGDWCLGPDAEAALASGQRAAQAMMNYLGQPTP
jgi:hypothetical protein